MRGHAAAGIGRRINAERVVVLGLGRAVLLQLAHPLVAAGVADHSQFEEGLHGYLARTRRTIGAMLSLTFGSDAEARETAARINAIHDRVHGVLGEDAGLFSAGSVYSARDPHLLRWVHATLLDSVLQAYEMFVRPLTREEKDRYCAEAAETGRLFGIPDDLLPTRFDELQRYMHEMLEGGQLHVIPRARRLARSLLEPPLGRATFLLFRVLSLPTVGLLPPAIRAAYGFPWDARQDRRLHRAVTAVRCARSCMPRLVREWAAARRTT